jgi:hypothetical protein
VHCTLFSFDETPFFDYIGLVMADYERTYEAGGLFDE